MRVGVKLRACALLAGAALALHQLRYLIAYGGHSESALATSGHAYLAVVTPIVLMVLALGVVQFALRLQRASTDGGTEPAMPTTAKLWTAASLCLTAVYCAQELIEGQLAGGPASGLGAGVGGGGWIAGFLAVALGGLVALLLRGADQAVRTAAARARRRTREQAPLIAPARPSDVPRLDILACFLAGRGPPHAFA